MKIFDLKDTIAAISTPLGESGIGIVRISGANALKIADKIFLSRDRSSPLSFETYTTHYGWILEPRCPIPNTRKKSSPQHFPSSIGYIDEVILTVMRAPRSYTKEDIVEINCHGGIIPLRKVLSLVLDCGARLARPGEFTLRAFLNGRLDLSQAEAVLDIIRAKTEAGLRVGLRQLRGGLSSKIEKIRNELLRVLTVLEADIDFPEEEVASISHSDINKQLEKISMRLKALLQSAYYGKVFREGLSVVICGRPNVGKSSLLNALLKENRAIVTPIAGTTRDTIEEFLDIRGLPLKITDTAGIIEPRDIIEKEALKRSKRYIKGADLVIAVFDGSQPLLEEDEILMHRLDSRPTLAVINKIDLKQKIERERVINRFQEVSEISCLRNKNINLLEERIANLVFNGKVNAAESTIVSNARHIQALKKVHQAVNRARRSLRKNLSWEFVAYDIKEGLGYLDEISGKNYSGDLLQRIFNQFCIGK
jgi:tRNA modification GTPase